MNEEVTCYIGKFWISEDDNGEIILRINSKEAAEMVKQASTDQKMVRLTLIVEDDMTPDLINPSSLPELQVDGGGINE